MTTLRNCVATIPRRDVICSDLLDFQFNADRVGQYLRDLVASANVFRNPRQAENAMLRV
jgi:hypothetical protein